MLWTLHYRMTMRSMALFFLLLVIINYVHGRRLMELLPSATEAWKNVLPNVQLPAALANASLSLQVDTLSEYIAQIKNGRLVSPSAFCLENRLHCDATTMRRSCRVRFRYSYGYDICFGEAEEEASHAFFHESNITELGILSVPVLKDTTPAGPLLPGRLADVFPAVSAKNLAKFLKLFNFPAPSPMAITMEDSANACDEATEGCVSSLEGLAHLGLAYSHLLYATNGEGPLLNAKVAKYSAVQVKGQRILACHDTAFPFRVIFCHTFNPEETKVYKLNVEGAGGELIAVCHRDTSSWNPKHAAFRDLQSAPGKTDACHFMPENHMVWY